MSLNTDNTQHMLEMKYRPNTIAECILPSRDTETFNGMIKKGRLAHLLLCSKSPGTGKTTVARALANEIDAEMMFISGGNLRIADLRNEITDFANTATRRKGGKVLIIDEGDNPDMKAVHKELRSWMEAYGDNCTVIMTCNNSEVIPKALKSRFRTVEFGTIVADSEEKVREEEARMKFAMIKRCLQICESEGLVVEDKKIIKELVVKNFPDFRKTVTELDTYSSNGVIDVGILNIINRSSKDMDLLFTLIKEKDIRSIRSLIPNFASNYSGFINQFYEQAMMRVSGSPRMVIKILAENQKYADTVPNIEIHLIDMLADMAIEVTWK